jgi:general secretion pathway protein F
VQLYRFKAISSDGAIVEGEMMATSQAAVLERIRAQGQLPVRAEEAGGAGRSEKSLSLLPSLGKRVNEAQVATFTRDLATLLNAGLPLDRGLSIMLELADPSPMRDMLTQLRERVRSGTALSDAMSHHAGAFSRLYVNMVRAGEAGGALGPVLQRLADYLERSRALRESVKTALIYPALLVFVAGLSVAILLIFVVPQFKQMFDDMGKALPLATQVVIGLGDGLRSYWWALLLLIVAAVMAVRVQLSQPAGKRAWDAGVLRLPLFGELSTKLEVARFSRTLGTLLSNGVTLLNALGIVKDTTMNMVLSDGVAKIGDGLKQGRGMFAPMLETGLFPKLATHMVRVGEETGKLEEMLLRVADIYDLEVERTIKRLLAIVEPALILTLGVIIAGIIMSILLAILGANELVR